MSIFNLKQVIPFRSFGIDKQKYDLVIKRVSVSVGLIAFIATYFFGMAAFSFLPWVIFGWFPSGLIAFITANLIYHMLKPSLEHERKPSF